MRKKRIHPLSITNEVICLENGSEAWFVFELTTINDAYNPRLFINSKDYFSKGENVKA
ncbi:hypothetical protein [Oceanobacillus damuensis]|uniref:hypothetical protein n=1 Tax=Oceanobacillus damuensis TaxID=937928 RepID=UPI000B19419E|nr:hypothetical protein [Oceanobacillus damuensis]